MKEKVKVGFIGVGNRCRLLIDKCFTDMSDVETVAICDLEDFPISETLKIFERKSLPAPRVTKDADEIINDPEIDAVVIVTGWREHAELSKRSVLAGKYTAVEVGCAFDLSECFELIEAYEKTKAPLMMLENCCYGRFEMMGLRLAREGLFGDIVHCTGAYAHHLPDVELFAFENRSYPHYRINSYINRNCEQYPTHALGPIAKVLNINRGNRFMTISSFASKSGALKAAEKRILGEDNKYSACNYKQGDIITSVITCANGETIQLSLDTTAPRPYYSRDFGIRGTIGMMSEERHTVFFQGMEEPTENNMNEMYEKYDHPLHREFHSLGEKGGHGGMDWLVARAFIESVKAGVNTPIDAYDTVALMAIASLSEMSIEKGGAPISFPDFTKGRWMDKKPIDTVGKYSLEEIIEDKDMPIFP